MARQEFIFHLEPQTTEDEFNDFLASIPLPSEVLSEAKDFPLIACVHS